MATGRFGGRDSACGLAVGIPFKDNQMTREAGAVQVAWGHERPSALSGMSAGRTTSLQVWRHVGRDRSNFILGK
jgi:hypothetical protein